MQRKQHVLWIPNKSPLLRLPELPGVRYRVPVPVYCGSLEGRMWTKMPTGQHFCGDTKVFFHLNLNLTIFLLNLKIISSSSLHPLFLFFPFDILLVYLTVRRILAAGTGTASGDIVCQCNVGLTGPQCTDPIPFPWQYYSFPVDNSSCTQFVAEGSSTCFQTFLSNGTIDVTDASWLNGTCPEQVPALVT